MILGTFRRVNDCAERLWRFDRLEADRAVSAPPSKLSLPSLLSLSPSAVAAGATRAASFLRVGRRASTGTGSAGAT
jgi:hypothetical protein